MSTEAAIADRLEIGDLFARLARLLDEGRWDDAATIFTDDVALHSPRGELRGIDKLVAFMRQTQVEGEQYQHLHTDLLVNVEGDQATASANSLVYFYRDGHPPHRTSGLRPTYTAVRTTAGWRFSEGQTTLAWTHEN